MRKAAVAAAAVMILLVSSVHARAAGPVACDQATLSKLETELGAMSGKAGKQAMKKLDKAKQALKDGNTKKCGRLLERIKSGKSKTPDTEPDQGPEPDEGSQMDEGDNG
jgi:hypothetical protein